MFFFKLQNATLALSFSTFFSESVFKSCSRRWPILLESMEYIVWSLMYINTKNQCSLAWLHEGNRIISQLSSMTSRLFEGVVIVCVGLLGALQRTSTSALFIIWTSGYFSWSMDKAISTVSSMKPPLSKIIFVSNRHPVLVGRTVFLLYIHFKIPSETGMRLIENSCALIISTFGGKFANSCPANCGSGGTKTRFLNWAGWWIWLDAAREAGGLTKFGAALELAGAGTETETCLDKEDCAAGCCDGDDEGKERSTGKANGDGDFWCEGDGWRCDWGELKSTAIFESRPCKFACVFSRCWGERSNRNKSFGGSVYQINFIIRERSFKINSSSKSLCVTTC